MKRFLGSLALILFLASPAWAFKFASGSFSGNATDNRDITISPAFQPNVVFIKCDTTQRAIWSTSAMAADTSYELSNSSAGFANGIQAFNADGFQVGTHATANASGVTCYYVAFATDANNDLSVGVYVGDGLDNKNITISPAFQPEMCLVRKDSATTGNSVWRGDHSGDLTSFLGSIAEVANAIQQYNENTVTMRWFAVKTPVYASKRRPQQPIFFP